MCLRKITSEEVFIQELRLAKANQRIIVTTNGSFDLLHIGHVRYLQKARAYGDILAVAINSDSSIRKIKGPFRPILPQHERAEMLAALECVDWVTIFQADNPLHLLRAIGPHFHIKGGSFLTERIAQERAIVESFGGQMLTLPMEGDYSSTRLIEKIRQQKEINPT
jgi:D-beta-D-heptose 7-phosphate kinase/D-beta-D-heptose 1-phosphate adenosyltransferase